MFRPCCIGFACGGARTVMTPMQIPGKRIKRTRWVKPERFIVVLEVEVVIPDADPSEACYEPAIVELLREVEKHAKDGDVSWLRQYGKVYKAVEAA